MVLAGALTACGSASVADEATLVADLCDAIAAEDAATAGEVFEGRVHRPLHDLADEAQAADRSVATRLLEAKFAVETVVRGDVDAPAPLVRQRLEDLATEVRTTLEALDRPAPSC